MTDVQLIADRSAIYVPAAASHLLWTVLLLVLVVGGGWVSQQLGAPDWVGLATLAAAAILVLVAWPIDRYVYERRIESAIARLLQTATGPARLMQLENARSGVAELLVFAEAGPDDARVWMERRRMGRYFAYHLVTSRDGRMRRHPIGGAGVRAITPVIEAFRSDR